MCVKLQKKIRYWQFKKSFIHQIHSTFFSFFWKYRAANLIETHSRCHDTIQTKQNMATFLKEIKS